MQYYDISIPVNGAREINVQGDYVYYLNGSAGGADSAITLRSISGSDSVILRPGQAMRLGSGQGLYNRWIVGNYAGQAPIVGTLLMGEGEFFDNRISGSVEVIDGGRSRSLAGVAFLGAADKMAPASFAHSQLYNAVGSGKRLIVEAFSISSTATSTIGMGYSAVPLPTLVTAPPKSKKVGGATSTAELRTGDMATMQNANEFGVFLIQANTTFTYKLNEPMVIEPGMGLLFYQAGLATILRVTYEFFEESL